MKVASLFIEKMSNLNLVEIRVLKNFEIRNKILDIWFSPSSEENINFQGCRRWEDHVFCMFVLKSKFNLIYNFYYLDTI